ncbi:MAG: DUF2802 domain-containing protein [Betaproteobacteria bacterium]|nr:DUF2802 domain-containing protein [Betaproteobacteria bacterium]
MRQLVYWLIALLFVYGGWQFFRALRIGFRRQAVSSTATNATNLGDDLFNYDEASASAKESETGVTVAIYSQRSQPGITAPEEVKEAPLDPFAVELELQRLRLEINTLRELVETQQKEIDFLRTKAKDSATDRVKASISLSAQEPDMSPEYDEALALARRGIMADVIASRCGITRAEADLVASLAARGRKREATTGEAL